ncbi:MAG: hypothetical protein ACOVSI_00810 [Gemmatimonas sp.]|jgi:hypothetical protein
MMEDKTHQPPTVGEEVVVHVIAEADIKKDSRNRITLPASLEYEYFHMLQFEDGHVELHPRKLVPATISARALADMDLAMTNLSQGKVGAPLDVDELQRLADLAD